MKQLLFFILTVAGSASVFSQTGSREELLAIAKTYSNYMFANEADKSTLAALKAKETGEWRATAAFVRQCITTKNKLLTPAFLTLPEATTLRQIYHIQALHVNWNADTPLPDETVLDSLEQRTIPRNELIDNYYSLLFTGVGNKNQPFNLSKADFDLSAMGLANATEKSIFYFQCMELCRTVIWGYMNIANPPNTKEILNHIKRYPKFSGQPYYAYNDFFFEDFEMVILTGKAPESYKSYYLNKVYETLIYHCFALIEENAPEEAVQGLLLGSIMHDERLWDYTEDYRSTLERVFSEAPEE